MGAIHAFGPPGQSIEQLSEAMKKASKMISQCSEIVKLALGFDCEMLDKAMTMIFGVIQSVAPRSIYPLNVKLGQTN
jgi:hypothetical protein